jgi:acyl-[acyl-carrier-protein] desaturase
VSAVIDERDLLKELEPKAEEYLNRHTSMAKEWFPHLYIPYGEGRDFDRDPWTPDQPRLTGVAQMAFEVNLLTEDNLPSYHREVYDMFVSKRDRESPWLDWVHRWTAEEGRHAIVLRDYLVVTRNIDPVALERNRMATMEEGYDREGKTLLQGMAYVSFQELATRVSHRNTGRYSEDPVADRIMARISADENLHMVFYRDVLTAAMHIDPSQAVRAIVEEVKGFEMPGAGMPEFRRKAVEIAKAGIYDLRVHHDDVVQPLLKHWDIWNVSGLTEDGERALEELRVELAELERKATRFEEKREKMRQREAARAE